jgi:hypothetical protein
LGLGLAGLGLGLSSKGYVLCFCSLNTESTYKGCLKLGSLVKPQAEESERQPQWRYIAPKPKPTDPAPQSAAESDAITAPNIAEPPSANASPRRRQAPTVAPKQVSK